MENLTQTELSKSLNIVWHPHPVSPIAGRETLVATVLEGRSVREILIAAGIDTHQPIVIHLDDRLLLVTEWDTICPRQGQLLNVQATVMGGDTLRTVALLAVVVVAAAVSAGALGPAGLGLLGASFGASTVATGIAWGSVIAGAVIAAGGSMLVNSIFSPKAQNIGTGSALSVGGGVSGEYAKASPTYSLTGGSNSARPYESMPVIMGNHRFFPDFGSKPFTQYLGTDQYLYQIFHLGVSNADIYDWKIGTNPIGNYTDYAFHNTDGAGKMTDFPGNVDSISGAVLTYAAGAITRTSSTNTYQIALDIEAMLFYQNDQGGLDNRSIECLVRYRTAGVGGYSNAPLGTHGEGFEWLGNGVFRVTGNSQKPRRGTVFFNAGPGEFDVEITRLTPDSTDSREKTDANFSAMRSYQLDQAGYIGQKRVGLTIKASEQLNGTVDRLSAYAESYATYYDGVSWATTKTSNPANWFMHFARGQYASDGKLLFGVGLAESQLDIEGLAEWANFCFTEGLTFNAVLDANQTCADVLDAIAKCGFGSPSWASGKLGVVYDARDAAPTMTFGMGNIIRDSFDVTYITEQLAEEIVVRFRNPVKDWEQDEVRVVVPGVDSPLRTSSVDLYGCTDQTMAGKFANYLAAQQYYRRRRITWETDFEGFVCQRGDVVILSHDLTQWGYSGRVVSVNDFESITLDRAVPRNGGVEHLMLTRPDGSTSTYELAPGTVGSESDTLVTTNDFIYLQEGYSAVDHRWSFSPLATPGKKIKIVSIQPSSESRLKITATDEYPEFYNAWGGTFIAPTQDTLLPPAAITITNLSVVARPAIVNGFRTNRVTAYWGVGGGTRYSRVRVFFEGDLIAENAEVLTQDFEIDVYAGGLFRIEVTPFGITGNGATATAQLTIGSLELPPPPATVELYTDETGKTATFTWTRVYGVESYVFEVWSGGVVRRSVNVGNVLTWTYDVEDAISDGGPFRSYSVRVFSVSNSGQSLTYATASFSNPQIGLLSNARVEPMPNSLWFKYDRPLAPDFEAVKVWLSTTSEFTPSDATLAYQGNQNWITIDADLDGNPLASAVVYYVRAAGYDSFGQDNLTYTAELSATVLSPAWGLIEGDIDETVLSLGLNDRIDLIDTSGGPDMPNGLIDRVRLQAGDINLLDADVTSIGTKLLEAELKIQGNTDLLYDAGLTIDSNTGEVYIYGVKQNATSIAAAEIRLDGAEANINLKASYTYVDDAITTAVIDPSQIAELGALTTRVNNAEIDIDGLQATIILKADSTTVGTLAARVTTAEIDIDGLQGEITLKADSTTVSAIDNRVTTTEATLSALDVPSINLAVIDVRYVNNSINEQAETQLRDILTGQANYDANVIGIARAEQTLTAYVDEEISAESTARLLLQASLANTDAVLANEQIVRAEADSAEVTARLALAVRVTDAETGLTAAQAAIVTEQSTRATADTALASSITTLTSQVASNTAAISSEATTRATNDTALASSITTVQTTVGEHTTSIQTNATSIDGIQGKYSVKVDANGYVAGFGIISDANNATPYSEFAIVADRFSIAPVATNPSAVDGSPFFVLSAPTVIGGVTIPAGTYMKAAFIHDATITTAKIENAAITTAKINDASINTAKIIDANITTAKIGDAQITTAKIGDAQITTAKIGDAQITTAKIVNASIIDAKIANAAITTAKIADANITAAKIADANITEAKIADAAITNAKIAYLDAAKINSGFISADRIQTGSIDAKIANINAAVIQDATITNAKIGNLQIDGNKIGAAAVGTVKIANNAVTISNCIVGNGTHYFSTDFGGTLSAIAYSGGSLNQNPLYMIADNDWSNSVPPGSPIFNSNDPGQGVQAYGPTSACFSWNLGAGGHSIGVYQNEQAYAPVRLIWIFTQR